MAKVTAKAVARAAGVSPSSVSNAYNKPDQLSAPVRDHILAVAAQLGYHGPDPAGRALRSGRADVIGVLMTQHNSYAFSDPYAIGFLRGVAEELAASQTGILLLPPTAAAVQRASIDAVTSLCLQSTAPAIEAALVRGIPVVSSVTDPRPDIDHVAIDDVAAGAQLGEHLARLGHRDVAVLLDDGTHTPGTPAGPEFVDNVDRLRGLRRALGDASIRLFTSSENNYNEGRAAVSSIWDARDRPSAIVAFSDTMALGVMDGLRERGAVAGADVSLAGFDDIPEASGRGLTTVQQPIEEKGRRVARLMLDPDLPDRRVILPTRLVVRSSTAPAPR